MYNGIINVYKEKGYTSFDVIARLRGILKQKKIGHTGTLDPDAEGVLVVCLGKATKLCDILTDKDKRYDATLLLGVRTDTEDSSGKVLSESEVTASKDDIIAAVMSFVGEYNQIPPMYSAIKVNGKKLYELARQGIEVERTPRPVVIHDIDIKDIDIPYVRFSVSCGKGTYIRSLCRDIGDKLSCGGIMDSLIRSSVNSSETGAKFFVEDSLKLQEIEELVNNNRIEDYILTIDKMFPELSKVKVTSEGNARLLNGNILYYKDFRINDTTASDEDIGCVFGKPEKERDILVYNRDGVFSAIYRYQDSVHGWKAYKMFL